MHASYGEPDKANRAASNFEIRTYRHLAYVLWHLKPKSRIVMVS